MAEVVKVESVHVVLSELEARLVQGLLWHVRLGQDGWNAIASDLATSLTEVFGEFNESMPHVYFTFEDGAGNEVDIGDVYPTIEVGDE